ncbi:MAG: TolC family protein [Odoribacter sp.]|nr:TolC family protein [Odoribacter sp.]
MKKIIFIIIAASLLASCSGTKNLTKPQLDLPFEIAAAATDSASIADLEWWQVYTDSTLVRIIRRVLDNNPDLLIASARIDELGQLYGVDKLVYLPTVNGIIGATRETNHYDGKSFSIDSEVSFKASVRWEIDLWGGLSQRRRASAATYKASVEDRRALQMTLIAQTATAYFNLIALEAELDIVQRTLITRREGVEKARLRYEGGLTSELVYQQAKVELATTEALVPSLNNRIAMARNAITLLMGEYPETEIGIPNVELMQVRPVAMPAAISSELITRRPDLRASEQRLQVAMANCGVAYSDQFPRLTIGLTGGWENDQVANLFTSPFSYMLGNIAGTIFDFGRNHRRYKSKIAAYEQARIRYEKDVMVAFTEVSNARTAYSSIRNTVERRTDLRDAAFQYVTLANRQYIGGSISYIDVLDAYRRYFDAQISLINAVRDEYLAIVTLYKTLGGGAPLE